MWSKFGSLSVLFILELDFAIGAVMCRTQWSTTFTYFSFMYVGLLTDTYVHAYLRVPNMWTCISGANMWPPV